MNVKCLDSNGTILVKNELCELLSIVGNIYVVKREKSVMKLYGSRFTPFFESTPRGVLKDIFDSYKEVDNSKKTKVYKMCRKCRRINL